MTRPLASRSGLTEIALVCLCKYPMNLALQLRFRFDMRTSGFGLMGSSPERPCDDARGLNPSSRKPDGDAADFLN